MTIDLGVLSNEVYCPKKVKKNNHYFDHIFMARSADNRLSPAKNAADNRLSAAKSAADNQLHIFPINQ